MFGETLKAPLMHARRLGSRAGKEERGCLGKPSKKGGGGEWVQESQGSNSEGPRKKGPQGGERGGPGEGLSKAMGGSHRAGGGRGGLGGFASQQQGLRYGEIRVCLFEMLLSRKPRRIGVMSWDVPPYTKLLTVLNRANVGRLLLSLLTVLLVYLGNIPSYVL